jgi:hypothetical protein
MVTIERLQELLQMYGWRPTSVEHGFLTATFMTEDEAAAFLILIQSEGNWVRLSIPVYLPQATEHDWPALSELALRLNNESHLARFVLAPDRTLQPVADVYAENELDYEPFEVALDTLCYLAESAHPRLLAVAASQPDPGARLQMVPPPEGPFALANHVFVDSPFEDTPTSERFVMALVEDPANFVGVDVFGNYWFAQNDSEGGQYWAQMRDGVIWRVGRSKTVRPWRMNGDRQS